MAKKSILQYQVDDFNLTKLMMLLSGVVFVGLVVLYVSVLGLDKKEDNYIDLEPVIQTPKPQVGEAYFELGETAITSGPQSIVLSVNTANRAVHGVDAVLTYDDSVVKIDRVIYEGVFDEVKIDDGKPGMLMISAWNRDLVSTFDGSGEVATIFYSRVTDNDVMFDFDCTDGQKDDSNISAFGDDLIDCHKNMSFKKEMKDSPSMLVSNEIYFQEALPSVGMVLPYDWTVGFATAGCEAATPARPYNVRAVTGVNPGEVNLSWSRVDGASHYSVTYGEEWLNFDYGSSNIGDTDNYVVTGLKPGVTYYFVVTAVNNCASSGYSEGVQAVAKGSLMITNNVVTNIPDENMSAGGYDWEYEDVVEEKGAEVIELEQEATESANTKKSEMQKNNMDTPDDAIVYKAEPQTKSFGEWLKENLPFIGLALLVLLGAIILWMRSRGNGDPHQGQPQPQPGPQLEPQPEQLEMSEATQEEIEEKVRNYDPQVDSEDVEPPFSDNDKSVKFPDGF